MQENRAILMTAGGAAALAVVRMAGPAVGGFLREHFSGRPAEGKPAYGKLCDGQRVIDDPVVVLSSGGQVADLSLHGGLWVVQEVLKLARVAGFQVNDRPGLPLPEEALDASNALEGEVLAYLPMARTEQAIRALLAQPQAWTQVKRPAAEILDDWSLYWLLHLPRVAIIGAPNAGKSTLANQLFAQERSITADLPGTTRDWVGEIANLDGLAVMLVDTPGLRETADPIEQAAIKRSGEEVKRADLVVLVLDASQPLEGQRRLMSQYPQALLVINKCDQAGVWNVGVADGIHTVAAVGQGIDELRAAIRDRFGCRQIEIDQARWWTERQRAILQQAVDNPSRLAEI